VFSFHAGATGDGPLPAGARVRLGDGSQAIGALAVAPDGASVAVARGSDIGLFRPFGTELRTLRGHSRPIHHIEYSPCDDMLVSAAEPGDSSPLRFWNSATGELLHQWGAANRTVRDFAVSPDGQTLVVLEPNAVTLHNPRLGRFTASLPLPDGASDCHRLALSSDGATLVAGCERDRLVWDLSTRQLMRGSPARAPCRGLFFLANDRRLVWLDSDDLRFWSLPTDDVPPFFAGRYVRNVTALTVSRDKGRLALAQATDVTIWDITERTLLKRFDGHRAAVRAMAFTPDGQSLITGDDSGTALVWDIGK
jgi:WD40 repeat protein